VQTLKYWRELNSETHTFAPDVYAAIEMKDDLPDSSVMTSLAERAPLLIAAAAAVAVEMDLGRLRFTSKLLVAV